jgi:hypothetical protein
MYQQLACCYEVHQNSHSSSLTLFNALGVAKGLAMWNGLTQSHLLPFFAAFGLRPQASPICDADIIAIAGHTGFPAP